MVLGHWRGGYLDKVEYLRVSTVRQVSNELNYLVDHNEPVISFWPGYLVECQCIPEVGTENDFALWISPKLTAEQAAKRRIITMPAWKSCLIGIILER